MKYFFVLFLIFFPILSGIVGYFISRKIQRARDYLFIGCNILEMVVMIILSIIYKSFSSPLISIPYVVGGGISFKVDAFRVIYATISIFLWMMCIIFSK